MAKLDVQVPASAVANYFDIHVTVTGQRRWRARWWVALRLLRLGAWVAGCGLRVERTPDVRL